MRIIRIWKESGRRNWLMRALSVKKYYGAIMYAVERSNAHTRYATEHTRRTFYFETEQACNAWYHKKITSEEFDGDGFTLNA